MTPRKFTQWIVAIFVAAVALLLVAHFSFEVLNQEYIAFGAGAEMVRNNQLNISGIISAIVAAAISTFLVFLFGGTRGALDFKALGFQFTGPSGPITLWCMCFIAIIIGIKVLTG